MPHAMGKKKGESAASYAKRAKAVHDAAPEINALEEESRGLSAGLIRQPYIGRASKGGLSVRGSATDPTSERGSLENRRRYGVEVKAKRRRRLAAMRAGY